ncbi:MULTISPECIES: hypothetical protein [unclassified Rhodococcus (in: high G+C Gram-positive bacteria)]|uniref:hypothetical protein n=1 Tax=unclassified Rhodococcus (in: high G+C Gram-positive bacteria) TaxID=192944 RepID=UPI0012F494D6|nr:MULTISPECIES: hypothetical protein [unclassified Rhodococcus (in: high G+C Gram-positive bacteria)]
MTIDVVDTVIYTDGDTHQQARESPPAAAPNLGCRMWVDCGLASSLPISYPHIVVR